MQTLINSLFDGVGWNECPRLFTKSFSKSYNDLMSIYLNKPRAFA